jgi:23S rRNA (cytosine1962-C5)-methyltransferase
MPEVYLSPRALRSLNRLHPWIFSGAIVKVKGNPDLGDTVAIYSIDGDLLGQGAFSPESQIRVRIWTFEPEEEVNEAFFRKRLAAAIAARASFASSSACRLVNAESDGLPGLIVDRYAGFLVCQFLAAGIERHKSEIVAALSELVQPAGIYERSDTASRTKEGLEPRVGVLAGAEPPPLIEIGENGCRYLVDVRAGHKTGFYLDQRENRATVGSLVKGMEVLNCFAYTGGFSVVALAGGARQVTNIESSAAALQLADRNFALNNFPAESIENICGDVFAVLRQFRNTGRTFDAIILDPPKFAESRSQLERASRGYKDINLLAFKLLNPGGLLFTFSCSGHMEPALFQKIVAGAALDAGRFGQIIKIRGQAGDHPVALNFPEGAYLKGLVVRV